MRTLQGIRILLLALPATTAPAGAFAEYSDCRTCHFDTAVEEAAPDLTNYFISPGHHPVRVTYPATEQFYQPGGALSGILFFDRNGNGVADLDEIQIFNSSLTATAAPAPAPKSRSPKKTQVVDNWVIDCASCHIEHGTTVPDPGHAADYVRSAGDERLLCVTCHRI